MAGAEGEVKRSPILLIIIIAIICLFALFTLSKEIVALLSQKKTINSMNLILSVSTIALSIYILTQVIRGSRNLNSESSKVITVLQCINCGYNNAREFEKGDYILKEVSVCPKCGGQVIIHSIFREVKTREKRLKY